MAPVVRALRETAWARCRVLVTGQHRDLLAPILDLFDIVPDRTLNVMRPGQSLIELTTKLLAGLGEVYADEQPDLVIGQGDTTSVLATSLASFSMGIPFAHVEAGLRTGRLDAPFPEEGNRVVAGHLSMLHFAPTRLARRNLRREGIDSSRIIVSGNTVIDAMLTVAGRDEPIREPIDRASRVVLVTAHRRDVVGEPLKAICQAIQILLERHPDVEFLWPLHPNPAIGQTVGKALGHFPRVHLTEPLCYARFVAAMKRSTLILTDSGGIQEEAPALGKPVLVLRRESERPEAIAAGVAKLVGRESDRIVSETSKLLNDPSAYAAMAQGISPYGDGHASRRIVSALARHFQIRPLRAARHPNALPVRTRG
jgi:UDP-N-acetylglucosamine 2-epimerase (non-hydrolysing)